jgi:hypothetical protein
MALQQKNMLFRLTLICRSHSSSEVSKRDKGELIPALFINMSTFPYVERLFSITFSTSFWLVTSALIEIAFVPIFITSSTTLSAFSRSISTMTQSAPCLANSRVIARPMPRPAPVIIATLLSKFMTFIPLLFLSWDLPANPDIILSATPSGPNYLTAIFATVVTTPAIKRLQQLRHALLSIQCI